MPAAKEKKRDRRLFISSKRTLEAVESGLKRESGVLKTERLLPSVLRTVLNEEKFFRILRVLRSFEKAPGGSRVPIFRWDQYIPPIPPPIPPAGAAGVSSGWLTTSASVVRTVEATLAAFWSALLDTLVGSTIPDFTMSQ